MNTVSSQIKAEKETDKGDNHKKVKRFFFYKPTATSKEKLYGYGLAPRSHFLEVLIVILILQLLAFILIFTHVVTKISWEDALKVFLPLGTAIIVFRQWQATRHEISIDKYYDRLDTANKRLEALNDVPKVNMHVFAELDKLEYVVMKYELGYMYPKLAYRAIENFKGLCKDRPGFHERASQLIEIAVYLDKTKCVVRKICDECVIAASNATS